MVSFNCDGCGDVVKKPKLLQHYNRCYASVTCLDCSFQFSSPNEFKSHNTCVSEAEKYEKTVYRGPKHNHVTNQNGSPSKQPVTPNKQEQNKVVEQNDNNKQEEKLIEKSTKEKKKEKSNKRKRQDQEEKEEEKSPKEEDEKDVKQDSEEEEDEDEHDQDKVIKPLSEKDLEAFKKKQKKLGVIYISRIPPGMTPAKVRHILGNFGEIGRIYLHDGNKEKGKSKKRGSANYSEGWVEFQSKKVAKAAADMLNAQPIGGLAASKSKKSGTGETSTKMGKSFRRFKDDVWTMRYLKGFKWHMLSEQLAQERASHTARLRTELSQSAFEQKDYLKKVERARIQNEKVQKKKRKSEKNPESASAGATDSDRFQSEKFRTFKQRKPVFNDVRDQRAATEAVKE